MLVDVTYTCMVSPGRTGGCCAGQALHCSSPEIPSLPDLLCAESSAADEDRFQQRLIQLPSPVGMTPAAAGNMLKCPGNLHAAAAWMQSGPLSSPTTATAAIKHVQQQCQHGTQPTCSTCNLDLASGLPHCSPSMAGFSAFGISGLDIEHLPAYGHSGDMAEHLEQLAQGPHEHSWLTSTATGTNGGSMFASPAAVTAASAAAANGAFSGPLSRGALGDCAPSVTPQGTDTVMQPLVQQLSAAAGNKQQLQAAGVWDCQPNIVGSCIPSRAATAAAAAGQGPGSSLAGQQQQQQACSLDLPDNSGSGSCSGCGSSGGPAGCAGCQGLSGGVDSASSLVTQHPWIPMQEAVVMPPAGFVPVAAATANTDGAPAAGATGTNAVEPAALAAATVQMPCDQQALQQVSARYPAGSVVHWPQSMVPTPASASLLPLQRSSLPPGPTPEMLPLQAPGLVLAGSTGQSAAAPAPAPPPSTHAERGYLQLLMSDDDGIKGTTAPPAAAATTAAAVAPAAAAAAGHSRRSRMQRLGRQQVVTYAGVQRQAGHTAGLQQLQPVARPLFAQPAEGIIRRPGLTGQEVLGGGVNFHLEPHVLVKLPYRPRKRTRAPPKAGQSQPDGAEPNKRARRGAVVPNAAASSGAAATAAVGDGGDSAAEAGNAGSSAEAQPTPPPPPPPPTQQQQQQQVKPQQKSVLPSVDQVKPRHVKKGLVDLVVTMAERNAKRKNALNLVHQFEKFTQGEGTLEKPPKQMVKELAGTAAAVCCSLQSELLLESRRREKTLRKNPVALKGREDNDGHHPGHPGWIKVNKTPSSAEAAAADPAAAEEKARAKAVAIAFKEHRQAKALQERLLACGEDVAAAAQVAKEMLDQAAASKKAAWDSRQQQKQKQQQEDLLAAAATAATVGMPAAVQDPQQLAPVGTTATLLGPGMGMSFPLCFHSNPAAAAPWFGSLYADPTVAAALQQQYMQLQASLMTEPQQQLLQQQCTGQVAPENAALHPAVLGCSAAVSSGAGAGTGAAAVDEEAEQPQGTTPAAAQASNNHSSNSSGDQHQGQQRDTANAPEAENGSGTADEAAASAGSSTPVPNSSSKGHSDGEGDGPQRPGSCTAAVGHYADAGAATAATGVAPPPVCGSANREGMMSDAALVAAAAATAEAEAAAAAAAAAVAAMRPISAVVAASSDAAGGGMEAATAQRLSVVDAAEQQQQPTRMDPAATEATAAAAAATANGRLSAGAGQQAVPADGISGGLAAEPGLAGNSCGPVSMPAGLELLGPTEVLEMSDAMMEDLLQVPAHLDAMVMDWYSNQGVHINQQAGQMAAGLMLLQHQQQLWAATQNSIAAAGMNMPWQLSGHSMDQAQTSGGLQLTSQPQLQHQEPRHTPQAPWLYQQQQELAALMAAQGLHQPCCWPPSFMMQQQLILPATQQQQSQLGCSVFGSMLPVTGSARFGSFQGLVPPALVAEVPFIPSPLPAAAAAAGGSGNAAGAAMNAQQLVIPGAAAGQQLLSSRPRQFSTMLSQQGLTTWTPVGTTIGAAAGGLGAVNPQRPNQAGSAAAAAPGKQASQQQPGAAQMTEQQTGTAGHPSSKQQQRRPRSTPPTADAAAASRHKELTISAAAADAGAAAAALVQLQTSVIVCSGRVSEPATAAAAVEDQVAAAAAVQGRAAAGGRPRRIVKPSRVMTGAEYVSVLDYAEQDSETAGEAAAEASDASTHPLQDEAEADDDEKSEGLTSLEEEFDDDDLSSDDEADSKQYRVRPGGKNPESRRVRKITKASLREVYDQPIQKAARHLGIGVTVLKKFCRKFNIKRWPYRKLSSLQKLIKTVKNYTVANTAQEEEKDQVCSELLSVVDMLMEDPNTDLTERIKRLRQAIFKQEYKARRGSGRAGTNSPAHEAEEAADDDEGEDATEAAAAAAPAGRGVGRRKAGAAPAKPKRSQGRAAAPPS